jgi:SAM-dependent methyltransferase
MKDRIIHPDTHSKLVEVNENSFVFEDGSTLNIINGTPVLFGCNSIFNEKDIIDSKSTTQSTKHLDTTNFKNFIRRKLLPQLTNDFHIKNRYENLATKLPAGGLVLIIGAGEKVNYYKSLFKTCTVITSDVHNGFKPDIIFDGHSIPFMNETFDLVLAAQVIEHVINPWLFCNELQRVSKYGGILQIEAPQNYPYHAEPYDFFRFTFTGLRSLFGKCEVIEVKITEGSASMIAVSISNYCINLSKIIFIQSAMLFATYILLGWLKYLDKLRPELNRRTISMPKGYAFTFKKDRVERSSTELFDEFYLLKP